MVKIFALQHDFCVHSRFPMLVVPSIIVHPHTVLEAEPSLHLVERIIAGHAAAEQDHDEHKLVSLDR